MRTLRILLPAAIALAGFLSPSMLVQAKPEYTKKEKKACAYCHVAADKKELNPVGDCYKEKHSLETCKPK